MFLFLLRLIDTGVALLSNIKLIFKSQYDPMQGKPKATPFSSI